jgi:hypothetical protein
VACRKADLLANFCCQNNNTNNRLAGLVLRLAGLHGAGTSAQVYRSTFVEFVELLLSRGFVVVLDLHWTSSTGVLATGRLFTCRKP